MFQRALWLNLAKGLLTKGSGSESHWKTSWGNFHAFILEEFLFHTCFTLSCSSSEHSLLCLSVPPGYWLIGFDGSRPSSCFPYVKTALLICQLSCIDCSQMSTPVRPRHIRIIIFIHWCRCILTCVDRLAVNVRHLTHNVMVSWVGGPELKWGGGDTHNTLM